MLVLLFKFQASEIGSKIEPPPSSTTEITVMITDINDETPRFRNAQYECEIVENASTNTPLTFLNDAVPDVFDHDQVIPPLHS